VQFLLLAFAATAAQPAQIACAEDRQAFARRTDAARPAMGVIGAPE